jgi:hypothetical protein
MGLVTGAKCAARSAAVPKKRGTMADGWWMVVDMTKERMNAELEFAPTSVGGYGFTMVCRGDATNGDWRQRRH